MANDGRQKRLIGAVIALVVLIVLLLLMLQAGRNRESQRGGGEVSSTSQPAVARATGGKPIRVGVIASWRSAEDIGPENAPRGYDKQLRIAADLRSDDITLIPLLESDGNTPEHLPRDLKVLFPDQAPITVNDAGGISGLDVIVNGETWSVDPALVNAIDQAVRGGVGLLNYSGLGTQQPGMNDPAVMSLTGLSDIQYATAPGAVACDALADHPILGPVKSSTALQLRPMGVFGRLPPGATGLVKVRDMNSISAGAAASGLDFYPIYVSQLGKGKIVGCQFAAYKLVPPELKGSLRGKFFQRCVRWLAGREVQ